MDKETPKKKKVTKMDIMRIHRGESRMFRLESYRACMSARVYCRELAYAYPRLDVARYSCSVDKKTNTITITAIGRDDEQK